MKIVAGAIGLLAIVWTSSSTAAPDVCKLWGQAAFDIAEQRVAGKPLSDVMAGIDKVIDTTFSELHDARPASLRKRISGLAIDVYSTHLIGGNAYRRIAELSCYKERQ